ncbi:ABC-type transport auxiliary lipoprotein family protein, partial [Rubrivivax gelatinosus]
ARTEAIRATALRREADALALPPAELKTLRQQSQRLHELGIRQDAVATRLAFELQADAAGSVLCVARWWLEDPAGRVPPRAGSATLKEPAGSAAAEEIVRAHRRVLWRLARLVATG